PPANRPGRPGDPPDRGTGSTWPVRDALSAGPVLLQGGRTAVSDQEEVFFGSSIPEVHPRTAAGYTGEGDLILLVVDGRQPSSRGVDLRELALILRDLGCVEAVNLDGGGSSTLVVNGTLVNRPVGGTYQREVMSALTVHYTP
ncbi:MAG: phosphodiester glycosidase family protein, partial [bacterium]